MTKHPTVSHEQDKKTLQKIFIIGLPRTGTTSVCASLLQQGYKVAHTAYVQKAFDEADVIADTPIFYHYQYLDKQYPNAKFVYLSREKEKWLPSIKQLLNRMSTNLLRNDGGFNLSIKECYLGLFSPFTAENINKDAFLSACYDKHQQAVTQYFSHRADDLLTIDISQSDSHTKLLRFLDSAAGASTDNGTDTGTDSKIESDTVIASFPKHNVGGKVTAWKDIKHPNKVESTHRGRSEKLSFKLI